MKARILLVLAAAACFGGGVSYQAHTPGEQSEIKKDFSASPGQAQKVLTAGDFSNGNIGRGSGRDPLTLLVEINPNLKPYQFRLIPDLNTTATGSSEKPRQVGRIEISERGSDVPIQTIEVDSHLDSSIFVRWVSARDMNFDGYLDLAIPDDSGAKWMSFNYCFFDKTTGRFVTTALTGELRMVRANEIALDPKAQEIVATRLGYQCPGGRSIFKIESGHLLLVQDDSYKPDGQECTLTTMKRVQGKMVLVDTQKTAVLNP